MSSSDYSTERDPAQSNPPLLPDDEGPSPSGEGAAPVDEAHPVDQIALRRIGGFNVVTPEQWSNLDKKRRLALIQRGDVTFLYQGQDVPVRAALLWLRTANKPAPELPQWPPPPLDAGARDAAPQAQPSDDGFPPNR